ncbi:unnamed protein product [Ectocarpus fasciculatus]
MQEETCWLQKGPKTMFFYLMRFKHTELGERKLTHRVDIPKEMDMAPFLAPPTSRGEDLQPDVYDLTGVVHHIGERTNSGHYVAFVRLTEQTWRRYSDGQVTPAQEQDVRSKNALILSYTRRR